MSSTPTTERRTTSGDWPTDPPAPHATSLSFSRQTGPWPRSLTAVMTDRDRALAALAQLTAAVTAPVTADLEDGTRPPADFAARHTTAPTAADEAGTDLFLNARIDTYLLGLGTPEHRLTETLSRAHRYVAAGADGIFVPGVTDPATLRALAAEIPVPLNVMAGPGAPSVAELGRLGVARVSLGSGVAQAAYAAARRAARELLDGGTYEVLAEAVAYPEMQGLLAAR
ncbi:isocitrate lyase/phosphoenolpyruvate mutase family protein [Streptomyces albidoflavus]